MGLLRRVAEKVKGKLAAGGAPASASAPRRPEPANAPEQALEGTLECGAQELKERLEAGEFVVIVEVRPAQALAAGTLAGATHIPLAELETRYGRRHPEIARAEAEVADVEGQIARETSQILANVKTELTVATERERMLEASLSDLKA